MDGHKDELLPRELSADSCNVADVDNLTSAAGDEVNVNVQDSLLVDVDDEEKIPDWIRCSPADLYFKRNSVLIVNKCAKLSFIHKLKVS